MFPREIPRLDGWAILLRAPCCPTTVSPTGLCLGPLLPAPMLVLILRLLPSSQPHNRHIGRADRILNITWWPRAGGSVAYGHTHLGGGRQEGRPVSRIRYPTLLYTCIALRVLQIYPNGLAMHLTSLATSSLLLRMFRFKLLSIMFKFKLKCIQLLSENN